MDNAGELSESEALAELERVSEEALNLRTAYLEARIEADRKQKAYEAAIEEKKADDETKKLSGDWYQSERSVNHLKSLVIKIDASEEKAQAAYDKARGVIRE